ncbi:MAG: IS3 family transposase [Bdellovibrionaceae bacterium]|nr:IS3 family transposase [Pseudobdellovibrionaceae bacterium]
MTIHRRQYSPEFKAKLVLQLLSGEKTSAEPCRTHKINNNVLNRWRKEFLEQAPSIFEKHDNHDKEDQKIAELERLVGQLTIQLDIGKKSLELLESRQKWELVILLSQEHLVSTICQVLNYARSQVYYPSKLEEDETTIKKEIVEIAGQYPVYGYRRLREELLRRGHVINNKRVRRLMSELGLVRPLERKRRRTTNSCHPYPRYPNLVLNIEINYPEQVWVGDITYIKLRQEFVYLAILMDVYTRGIRGWHLSRSLDQSLTITALNKALEKRCPEIHHSDQGVQYAGKEYIQILKEKRIKISMSEVGQAWQNGYAERLMRTIKEEEVDLSEYENYTEAYQQMEHFLEDVYMKKRIHSSLGYLTPTEYEQQWIEKLKRSMV